MIASPSPTYNVIKRLVDVMMASLALLVLFPVLCVIALLIWADDPAAPVIFRQRRCGKAGHEFELLKFRTMVRNADELKALLRDRSSVGWPDFRLTNDPRVTRVGRLLRKTSLDELPQLINVVKGDMTLVGPRPTSFLSDTYKLWQTARLDFKPGITGPWQVYGRDSMDFDQRCRAEIAFFGRPSLRGELWLIVLTAREVLRRSGIA